MHHVQTARFLHRRRRMPRELRGQGQLIFCRPPAKMMRLRPGAVAGFCIGGNFAVAHAAEQNSKATIYKSSNYRGVTYPAFAEEKVMQTVIDDLRRRHTLGSGDIVVTTTPLHSRPGLRILLCHQGKITSLHWELIQNQPEPTCSIENTSSLRRLPHTPSA